MRHPFRFPRGRRLRAHLFVLVLLAALGACGKKGPPLAPLRISPARIEDLFVVRVGDQVRMRFTVPSTNDNKTQPADIVAVEIYAITGKPEDPLGQSLNAVDFRRYAELVARVDVQPPPEAGGDAALGVPPAAAAAGAAVDRRPKQGEVAMARETIGPEQMVEWVHPRKREAKPVEVSDVVRPLAGPPTEEQLSRVYAAVGVSRKETRSALSNRVTLPLTDRNLSPPAPVVAGFTETLLGVSWIFPKDAPAPLQRAPVPEEIPARSLAVGRPINTYNVYEVTRQDGKVVEAERPINPTPLGVDGYSEPIGTLGKERCFVVRSGSQVGSARVEGPPSEVACTTPIDKFPPAAPKGLAAVGSEGGVSLIWDPNTEADLAGYLVLRGDAAAGAAEAKLTPLTAEPIRETTYRDTTARPGVRYVYAVVAVDNASPRNSSPESARVEEGAR